MSDVSDKPSQAEGEDPDRPTDSTGSEPGATGKPSQAEGEDPAPQSESGTSDGTADGETPSGA